MVVVLDVWLSQVDKYYSQSTTSPKLDYEIVLPLECLELEFECVPPIQPISISISTWGAVSVVTVVDIRYTDRGKIQVMIAQGKVQRLLIPENTLYLPLLCTRQNYVTFSPHSQ